MIQNYFRYKMFEISLTVRINYSASKSQVLLNYFKIDVIMASHVA